MTVAITALDGKIPPSRSDPTNFRTRADDYLGAFPALVSQQNAQNAENNAINANVNAKSLIADAAAIAAANAATAASSSTAPAWTAGTYSVGAIRRSTISPFFPYTCISARTSGDTTDPSLDTVGWRLTLLDIQTGYPLQQPSGVFDFTGGYLPAGVSFSRSSSSVSQSADGSRIEVGPNQPEFEYNAATGECLGVVPRPAATNLNTGGAFNDLTQAAWAKEQVTVSYSGGWSTITPSTANDSHFSYRAYIKPASALRYTMQAVVKKTSAYRHVLAFSDGITGELDSGVFDASTGQFVTAMVGSVFTAGLRHAKPLPDGSWLVTFSAISNTGTLILPTIISADASNATTFAGDGTSGIDVKNVAFWQGYPNQAPDLTGAVAARGADALTLPGGLLVGAEGAVYCEFYWPGFATGQYPVMVSIGGSASWFDLHVYAGVDLVLQRAEISPSYAVQASGGAPKIGINRVCLSWNGGAFDCCCNGKLSALSGPAFSSPPTITVGNRMGIADEANMPISEVRAYKHALTPGEMIAMTAGN